jgi:small subunit ribosomal protein S7
MPRRREVPKRNILPDPKFHDKTVAKLINILMLAGKKSIAESILYGALEVVAQKSNDEAVKVLKKSLDNIKPSLEVKSRRVGGSTYQVPIEVRPTHFAGNAMADQVLVCS